MTRVAGIKFMQRFQRMCVAGGWLLATVAVGLCSDWPGYRGPNHDGTSTDRILKSWPADGPLCLWKVPLTNGFSSFAVTQGKAYTLVTRSIGGQNQEACIALDAATGAELWAVPLGPASYDIGSGEGDGPRSTPSAKDGRVYALSAGLSLVCLDAQTGSNIWRRNLLSDYGGALIPWQNAASPLIDGDLIFVNCNAPDGTLLALNTVDGAEVWRREMEFMTHATPVAATIAGQQQIIFMAQSGLVSVNPQTGAVLWRYPFLYSTSTAVSPVVYGDTVFCTCAYTRTSDAVRVTRSNDMFTATQIWRSYTVFSQWMTPVCHEGFLYGMFGAAGPGGNINPLKCVELATGTEKWSVTGFGAGGTLLVDNHILVLTETGTLVLVKPNTNAYTEVARCQAVTGKCWNVGAVCDGRVYARSTQEGTCLDISIPALKLFQPLCKADGGLELYVGAANGTAIDSNRLAHIEVRASEHLTLDFWNWPKLTNGLLFTNGILRLDDPLGAERPQRYLIAIETP